MTDERPFDLDWLEAHRLPVPANERERIVGLVPVLEAADAMIWAITHADDPSLVGIEPPRAALLYGQPGTGKTMVARYIAARLGELDPGLAFYSFNNDELSPERIRGIFATLDAAEQRSVVHLDELEGWIESETRPTDDSRARRTAFLAALDGISGRRRAIALITTNVPPHAFHDPLVRSGRIGTKISFGLPDAEAARSLFERILAAAPAAELELDLLGEVGSGTPPAELTGAAVSAIAVARMNGRAVTTCDVLAALADRGEAGEIATLAPAENDLRHEWGHAVAGSLLFGPERLRAIILSRRGAASTRIDHSGRQRTEADLLADLVVLFAGRAGETLSGRVDLGAVADMETVNETLEKLRRNGHWPDLIHWSPYQTPAPAPVLARTDAAYAELERWAAASAEAIVAANAASLPPFIARFTGERVVSGGAWRDFVSAHPLVMPALAPAPTAGRAPVFPLADAVPQPVFNRTESGAGTPGRPRKSAAQGVPRRTRRAPRLGIS